MANSALRVGIACNIKTERSTDAEAEFDEPETLAAISAALEAGGFEAVVIEATEGFLQKLTAVAPDIVFNITEGRYGRSREAQVPAMLEYYGVPYTGSDATALSVALDKAMTKRLVQSCGIKTPAFCVVSREDIKPPTGSGMPDMPDGPNKPEGFDIPDIADMPDGFGVPDEPAFPVLVKPNAEGSSKGIFEDCVARDMAELRALLGRLTRDTEGDLLQEQYIDGREFTVGVLGNGPDIRVFEPMEVVFSRLKGRFKVYSYEVKRNYRDFISYACPPDLPPGPIAELKHSAKTIYQVLGCRDCARFDFRLSKDGQLFFIEANPLPGFAPGYSDFPMLAAFQGITYNDLILAVLGSALKRYGMKATREDG